jgi:hypothetical protein
MVVEGWVRTEITVSGDVLGLVHDVQLLPLDPPGQAPLDARAHQLSWRCDQAPCPHLVRARDAAGNVLAALGSPAAPRSVLPLPPPPQAPRSLWARPLPYAIGSAALAIAGGVFAWQLHGAQADLRSIEAARGEHTLAEAQDADGRRHRDQVGMIVGFAGAAVLGTTAVLVW